MKAQVYLGTRFMCYGLNFRPVPTGWGLGPFQL